jgi:hypothetical protein
MNHHCTRLRHRLTDGTLFGFRALRRRLGNRTPICFCLNSGRCGSASLVRLLRANGIRNCYHELTPDLHRVGVDYYHQRLSPEQVAREIRRTRAGVLFEANNRLFSLTGPILLAFPQAQFVFLYRDGRDVVRSGLQRRWYQDGDPFAATRLGADWVGSAFSKACRYWAEVNRQILGDLRTLGCRYISLRFEDLVRGDGLPELGDLLGTRLSPAVKFPSANGTRQWSVPCYEDWSEAWKQEFDDICGPVMRLLGYQLEEGAGGRRLPHRAGTRGCSTVS